MSKANTGQSCRQASGVIALVRIAAAEVERSAYINKESEDPLALLRVAFDVEPAGPSVDAPIHQCRLIARDIGAIVGELNRPAERGLKGQAPAREGSRSSGVREGQAGHGASAGVTRGARRAGAVGLRSRH